MRKKLFGTMLLLALCLFAATAAQATPITINITATVSYMDDVLNQLNGQIHVGSTITGSYTYESTTLDSIPDDPVVGHYRHYSQPYGVSLTVGGFNFETNPNSVNFLMGIGNVNPGGGADGYWFYSYNNLPLSNGVAVDSIGWQITDNTGTVFSSDALPTTAPIPLTQWQSNNLNIYGAGPDAFFISADVTSAEIVPEPATFLLVALGGLLLKKRLTSN